MNATLASLWQSAQRSTRKERWESAADEYQAITTAYPDFVPAWLELSLALEKLDRYRLSREAVLRAASAGGPTVDPMFGMAIARRLRRFDEVGLLRSYIDATNLDARVPPDKLVNLAMFASSAGDHRVALAWVKRALQSAPLMVDANNMLGLLHMFTGDTAGAATALRRTIHLQPSHGPAHSVLATLAPGTSGAAHIEQLQGLLKDPKVAARDEVHYAYALHHELHHLREYDDAWRALTRAFRARKSIQSYDALATRALFQRQRELHPTRVHSVPSDGQPTPIFIVGMHRSGTTLLERMLGGHSDVADAGETYCFTAQMRMAADHFCTGAADIELVERARDADFLQIGRSFWEALIQRARPARFITEKMNPNFILLGQICQALPGAKILHIHRNAVDTCFSNLRTLFTTEAPYSYDLIELADYYREYVDLMAHWSDVLGDRIMHVSYEELVSSPEDIVKQICGFTGLDFQSTMLATDREGGAVATASATLARAPIVRNRGNAWKPYEAQLQPLLDRLTHHNLL